MDDERPLIHRSPTFVSPFDRGQIQQDFYKKGHVFLDDCDKDALVGVCNHLGKVVMPRNEAVEGTSTSNIRLAPELAGKGYTSEGLFYHTDRSGWDLPPRVVAYALKTKSSEGGDTLLLDGCAAIKTISASDPDLYNLITSPEHSHFRCDDGTFQPRPIFDESMGRIRFMLDDGIRMSLALFEKLPSLKYIFGNEAFIVTLEPGQCYVVDNYRFLHGRTRFDGPREMLRIMASLHPIESRRVILFDVDGTLCNSSELSASAYYQCMAEMFGEEFANNNNRRVAQMNKPTSLALRRELVSEYRNDPSNLAQAVTTFGNKYRNSLRQSSRGGPHVYRYDDVVPVLRWLAQRCDTSGRETCIGLLSGEMRYSALDMIYQAGIPQDLFDLDISSFGDGWPNYLSMIQCSMWGAEKNYSRPPDPSKILLVSNAPPVIEAAKIAGCQVLTLGTGKLGVGDLDALAPYVVRRSTMRAAKPFMARFLDLDM